MPDKITIAAYRCHANGGTQVTIEQTNDEGHGWGRRLAGPKHYNMGTTTLVSEELDEHDAAEVAKMLAAVFPLTVHQLRAGAPDDHDALRLGLYANPAAAKQHGVAEYEQRFGPADLMWRHWDQDDDGVLRLHCLQADGDAIETDWYIVPLIAAASYDPDAEG